MLVVGANVSLGALWSANDLVTLLLMNFFYMQILDAEKPATLARLWQRVCDFCFTKPKHIKAFLERCLARLDHMEEAGLQPEAFVKNVRRKLRKVKAEWVSKPREPTLNLKHSIFLDQLRHNNALRLVEEDPD